MRVYMRGATHVKGTNSFKGVINPYIFEGVFRMDTVIVVHVCTCVCMVHGSFLTGMIHY